MNIIWDDDKNTKLKKDRKISFDEIALVILEQKFVEILQHPKRPGQKIFIITINDYIHVVPFVINANDNIILKTAFPSRKFHKQYWTIYHENKTR